MAAAVITVTQPSDVKPTIFGNKDVLWFDITADTGDYAANGFAITTKSLPPNGFGMRHVDFVDVGSVATTGTNGATANPIGVRYSNSGTTVRFQVYESAAAGSPPAEKGAEAYDANFTFRVMVVGTV